MTPIGSEMIVSTFPDLNTSSCVVWSSTMPLTTLILSRMCGLAEPELAPFTSWVLEQHRRRQGRDARTSSIFSAMLDASRAMTCDAPAWADMKERMPDPGYQPGPSVMHHGARRTELLRTTRASCSGRRTPPIPETSHSPAPTSKTILFWNATAALPKMALRYVPVRLISPIMLALHVSETASSEPAAKGLTDSATTSRS